MIGEIHDKDMLTSMRNINHAMTMYCRQVTQLEDKTTHNLKQPTIRSLSLDYLEELSREVKNFDAQLDKKLLVKHKKGQQAA